MQRNNGDMIIQFSTYISFESSALTAYISIYTFTCVPVTCKGILGPRLHVHAFIYVFNTLYMRAANNRTFFNERIRYLVKSQVTLEETGARTIPI